MLIAPELPYDETPELRLTEPDTPLDPEEDEEIITEPLLVEPSPE